MAGESVPGQTNNYDIIVVVIGPPAGMVGWLRDVVRAHTARRRARQGEHGER